MFDEVPKAGSADVPLVLEARLSQSTPLLLDGAMGTELERHGDRCELPLWSAEALRRSPDLVLGIHQEYAAAGAEVLTANSFRTQRRRLARAGIAERDDPLTTLAVALARSAARDRRTLDRSSPHVFVAGSAPPLADCFRPDLTAPDDELEREHARHCDLLAAAAADLILVETMNNIREIRIATQAAFATGLPVFVSFCCDASGRLLSGEPLADAVTAVSEHETPAAVLVNCLPPSALEAAVRILVASGLRFGVYPNLGAPLEAHDPRQPRRHAEDLDASAFAALALQLVDEGARIVGGCCGTSPHHIAAVAAALQAP